MEVRIEVETSDGRLPFRIFGGMPTVVGAQKRIMDSNNHLVFSELLTGTPSQWPAASGMQPFKGGFIFTLVLHEPAKVNEAAEWLKEELFGVVNCVRIGGNEVGEQRLTDTARYAELIEQSLV
jgi:hypothetical protein